MRGQPSLQSIFPLYYMSILHLAKIVIIPNLCSPPSDKTNQPKYRKLHQGILQNVERSRLESGTSKQSDKKGRGCDWFVGPSQTGLEKLVMDDQLSVA